MRFSLVSLAVLVLGAQSAAAWKPAEGPLVTRWVKDVSPDQVHPEYPRPQMVRKDWQNLNGLWDYAIVAKDAPQPQEYDGQILVPFPVQSALSGVMKEVGPEKCVWYHRTFQISEGWKGKRVLLHFQAVDWESTVTVNGKEVGEHRGGYDPFTLDVTDKLRKDANDLVVRVWDPTDTGYQPRGKQVLKPGGIFYTAVTGIWQTVWLEPVPEAHIGRLVLTPNVDGKCLRLTVSAAGDGDALTVEAVATDGGKEVGKVSGKANAELRLSVPDAKLWSPDTPHLYDLKVQLGANGKVLDSVTSYFGMRKIEIGKDDKGVTRMLLNGSFLFQVGPLDQGWWPDGLYIAPTDEAFKNDVEITRKLGFNMARKHVKVEPDRWYYWCDKLGLMVWQDMPSGNNKGDEGVRNFERELQAMIEAHRNHPCIIMWVVFNEGWGQHDTERLAAWVKEMDPSRLVDCASGWTDKNCGDVHDIHSYPNPKCPPTEEKRAAVLGEFGGLGLGIEGHTWKKEHWGYKGMADRDELTASYERLLEAAYRLRDTAGLSAAVYTQTTDVEVECNGLMTYDRAIIKPDLERVAAVNQGDFSRIPPPPILKTLVPTSAEKAAEWRYTFDKPADDWTKPGFDDAAWKKGPGGFGTAATPGAVVGTEWKTSDVWLRREITMPDGPFRKLSLRIHHDEDAEIYINGVLAGKCPGFTSEYVEAPLTPEGAAALKPGKNTIAVHCRQTGGGQFIDVGLVDVIPATK